MARMIDHALCAQSLVAVFAVVTHRLFWVELALCHKLGKLSVTRAMEDPLICLILFHHRLVTDAFLGCNFESLLELIGKYFFINHASKGFIVHKLRV